MRKLWFRRVIPGVILSVYCLVMPASGRAQNFSREYLDVTSFNHKIFDSPAVFTRSRFDQWVDFDSAWFKDDVDLDSVYFIQRGYFTSVRVDSNAFFNHSVFGSSIYFDSATFRGQAQFMADSFYDWVDFDHARFYDVNFFDSLWVRKQASFFADTFRKRTNFTYAIFGDYALFSYARFGDVAYFDSAHFSREAYFNDAGFDSACDFTHTQFDNVISFYKTRFGTKASFDQIIIGDSTTFQFYSSILPDTLYFTFIPRIANQIDLTTANFTDSTHYDKVSDSYLRPHRIFFYKADISKFRLDYVHFRLWFPEIFDGHRFPDDEKEAVYVALLNNFKVNGQGVSYELLDIDYQQFRWKRAGASLLIWLPKYWWNFGYDKEYVFLWTIGLILFFAAINFFALDYLNSKVYAVENVPSLPRVKYLFQLGPPGIVWRNIIRRWWYSLTYTSTIFFRLTLDLGKIRFKEKGGTIYVFIIYVLGVVCLAYMANFVLQKA